MQGEEYQEEFALPAYTKAHSHFLLNEIGRMEERCLHLAEMIGAGLPVTRKEYIECVTLTSYVSSVSRG